MKSSIVLLCLSLICSSAAHAEDLKVRVFEGTTTTTDGKAEKVTLMVVTQPGAKAPAVGPTSASLTFNADGMAPITVAFNSVQLDWESGPIHAVQTASVDSGGMLQEVQLSLNCGSLPERNELANFSCLYVSTLSPNPIQISFKQ